LDFGAWTDGIIQMNLINILTDKDRIFFINDTVRGPFIKNPNTNWYEVFGNMINDTVKLVGTTINCHYRVLYPCLNNIWKDSTYPHVQSMFLVTDKIGLNIAIQNKMFCKNKLLNSRNKCMFVANNEIRLSLIILNAGYNINAIAPMYRDMDYLNKSEHRKLNQNNEYGGDPWYNNQYFGKTLTPYDTIFFKTNCGVNQQLLNILTNEHLM